VQILDLLRHGEQCACVLLEDLEISQPTLSHHMKILCQSGIVKSRRAGKWSYYEIDPEGCAHAKRLLDRVADGKFGLVAKLANSARRLLVALATPPGDSVTGGCCARRYTR
jgi:DNA-binding transcriptional ArsR family regulator